VSDGEIDARRRMHAASEHVLAMNRLVAELRLATTIEEVRVIEAKMSRAADEYYAFLRAATTALRSETDELTARLRDLEARPPSRRAFIDVDLV